MELGSFVNGRRDVDVARRPGGLPYNVARGMKRGALVDALLKHDDPSVRWRVLVRVLGEDRKSKKVKAVQEQVRRSPRVRALRGSLHLAKGVYTKWQGAHWILTALADIGYPAGDSSLIPIRNQILDCWLRESFYQEFEARTKADAYKKDGVPIMQGRYRRCASQQGNALHFLIALGLGDQRLEKLVERLLHWQWPDGGWNCDKDPGADNSSFMESLLPMRGLAAYGREMRSAKAKDSALRASEVFLTRGLFRKRSDGTVIHPEFLQLHYPLYWHYDILGGLKGMVDIGLIRDSRCAAALDILEQKELRGGGWPAEKRYYKVSSKIELHADCVDWGGTGKKRMNEWITTDAMYVLAAAGRA